MQENQATGIDTKAMLPIFSGVYLIITELFLPWVSIPVLKYSKMETTYSLWKMLTCADNLQKASQSGEKLNAVLSLTEGERLVVSNFAKIMQISAVVISVILLITVILAYKQKHKAHIAIRMGFFVAMLLPVMMIWGVFQGNIWVNQMLGRSNTFINLSIRSYIQLTAFPYAQILVAVLMVLFAGKLLDTQKETYIPMIPNRSKKEDHAIGKRTWISILLILFVIPSLILFGIFFLNDRSESFIALCIIGTAMIPFIMVFEDRKPQAREILLISVLAALAVIGRVAFFMLPQFKPVTAIVIITGLSLGAEAGFLTGAMAGFASNFFFGQGPWTPWQMFSFGIIGFLAGVLFRGKRKRLRKSKLLICAFGGIATFVIYGFLMDTSTVLTYTSKFDWKSFLAVYVSGFPFNVIHGVSTVVFLYFLERPMERKINRIKMKYGILER